MNELLTAPPRNVTRVELKSRPAIEVFVLTLNGIEFLEMGEAMRKKSGSKATFSVELEHMLVDANAARLLQEGEGEAFLRTVTMRDMGLLRETMDAVNALTDQALEKTEKN